MKAFLKIEDCGKIIAVSDEETSGVIDRRVVRVRDWYEDDRGTFVVVMLGRMAQADIRKGDIVYGEFLVRAHAQSETNIIVLIDVVKIGYEDENK